MNPSGDVGRGGSGANDIPLGPRKPKAEPQDHAAAKTPAAAADAGAAPGDAVAPDAAASAASGPPRPVKREPGEVGFSSQGSSSQGQGQGQQESPRAA